MEHQRNELNVTVWRKWIILACVLALAGLGVWVWQARVAPNNLAVPVEASTPVRGQLDVVVTKTNPANSAATNAPEPEIEIQQLPPGHAYEPKDNIVEIELSEYAGYAGLIVANGGLEPTENSEYFKKGGFKVKFTLSEEESRPALNSGKIAALATTVDVLPIYGRQFDVVIPAQIGFSRGADGLVVRREIKLINHLKGRSLATAQFTEGDFFIRFLAQEAGLSIHVLPTLKSRPDPEKVNLLYCEDSFSAGDLFLKDLQDGNNLLAGCVTWAPKTTEVAEQSKGQATILVSSLNLLIIADILAVNAGFAQQNPDKLTALVAVMLEGNRQVRDNPDANLEVIGKAFKWDREKTKAELAKVHLSNLPENQAFFSGALETAATFDSIYQMSLNAYGKGLKKDRLKSSGFLELKPLEAAAKSGAFKEQTIAIAPIQLADAALPVDPLLSKDIRFLFEPNTFTLRIDLKDNQKNLEAIRQMLQISPGSTVLLRGHVDNAMAAEFRKKGGEKYFRQMARKALELSQHRALEIKRLLIERYDIEAARMTTTGRGWDEPAGNGQELNRRVEAQWFIIP
jgi:NitT/TauT family transport system substrate-binding protein